MMKAFGTMKHFCNIRNAISYI
jgi:hypothetical protein